MSWKHYPDSPWGDIDICIHGCTRPHGSTEKVCVFCDYPENANLELFWCEGCESITWHLDKHCLKCEVRNK